MSDLCAWCDAPKQGGAVCPACGADYAKAEAIRAHGRVIEPEPAAEPGRGAVPPETPTLETLDDAPLVADARLEKRICLAALPTMLLGAWLVQYTGVFDSLQRIVFGMPLHELGHAMSSWLLGFNAIPTFWKTVTASSRGLLCPALLFLAIGMLANYGRKREQRSWIVLAVFLWGLQLVGYFAFDPVTMEMLIIFGGDAMGMILATALMLTFYVGKDTQLYRGAVRWGFLFIGAAALMDMFMPWWRGQYDIGNIGYGMTGGLYTDAFLLVNQFGWSWDEMIARHLLVGYSCLAVLVIAYLLGLRQANRWIAEQETREAEALTEEPSD